MLTVLWLLAVIVGVVVLAYVNATGLVWTGAFAVALGVAWFAHLLPPWLALMLTAVFVLLALALNVTALRRKLVSEGILAGFRKVLPPMSATEREALEAGTVWWDGELFSGKPDWRKLLAVARPTLTDEEQSFVDQEVDALCGMITEWETTNIHGDLPPSVWQYIKDKGFLGLCIPKEYGGKGFSAYAHSRIIMKLSTHSSALSVSVMVPNSLGPAELLMHYGTDEQKRYYLPRLAKGVEIPCFALTGPTAGSDAASIPDYGIVCWGEHNGKRTLGLRVTWDKRYITLGPIATLLGLAFRAYDPEHLLGEREDLGITCALIPTAHPGVEIGRRHMPLAAVFQNGPNAGKDVFIPLDWVIGGTPMIGRGWRMLMECLAAGRGISLPSSSIGLAKLVARTVGAYARIRRQFKVPIGRFEGIEEPLARIAGNLYMMDATGALTAAAVDLGEKPAVLSGIAKLHITERAREVVNDGMDISGGKGICMGPSNFIGSAYMQMPVSITVEGANILTRSLIVFGQGAIRCHPYVLREMAAAQQADGEAAIAAFDNAFFAHLRFTLSNAARALVMGLTGSHFVGVPADVAPETRRYYQQITRFSASLALLADVSMAVLGGSLKRREKLSARLGDVLSLLYLCSATLKRFEAEGRQAADAPLMHWAIWDALFKAQNALEGVLSNFPNRWVANVVGWLIFPLGRPLVVPADHLGHRVARLLLAPSATRDRLTAGMFLGHSTDSGVGLVEHTLGAVLAAEPVEAKLGAAIKDGRIDGKLPPGEGAETLAERALAAGVIDASEVALLREARELTARVVRVDDFPQDLGWSEMRPVSAASGAAATTTTTIRRRAAA
jgi:acyl-CoA dehydrogenase